MNLSLMANAFFFSSNGLISITEKDGGSLVNLGNGVKVSCDSQKLLLFLGAKCTFELHFGFPGY
jgi:hypothetical protein